MTRRYDKFNSLPDDDAAEDFDTPAAKRKGVFPKAKAKAKQEAADTQGNVSASRGYFVRRSLRERDAEEEKPAFSKPRQRVLEEFDDEDEYYEEAGSTKAPKLVRVFAWVALLAIFFTGGYVGANYLFNKADRGGVHIGGVVGSGAEVREGAGLPSAEGLGEAEYKLYMPLAGGDFEERKIKIRKGLPEEDIQRILTVYTDGLKELSYFEPGVRVLNIFRSGDWLYVDMSGDFLKSVKALGREKSTLALTGMVRTIQENFPPIRKVKFYVDGKESKDKNPIDIENAWELKG